MTQQEVLKLETRAGSGKGVARKLRAQGMIPGVLYGGGKDTVSLAVNERELKRLDIGSSRLLTLILNGEEIPGVLREVQRDPVTMNPIHVDFLGVDITKEITVSVNVVLKGTPIGVKQEAGVLSHMARHLDILCLPGDIPDHIEVIVRELNIGDTIHVSDLVLEKGVFITPLDTGVATVLAPIVEKEPEVEEVEGEEVEGEEGEEAEDGTDEEKSEE